MFDMKDKIFDHQQEKKGNIPKQNKMSLALHHAFALVASIWNFVLGCYVMIYRLQTMGDRGLAQAESVDLSDPVLILGVSSLVVLSLWTIALWLSFVSGCCKLLDIVFIRTRRVYGVCVGAAFLTHTLATCLSTFFASATVTISAHGIVETDSVPIIHTSVWYMVPFLCTMFPIWICCFTRAYDRNRNSPLLTIDGQYDSHLDSLLSAENIL